MNNYIIGVASLFFSIAFGINFMIKNNVNLLDMFYSEKNTFKEVDFLTSNKDLVCIDHSNNERVLITKFELERYEENTKESWEFINHGGVAFVENNKGEKINAARCCFEDDEDCDLNKIKTKVKG